MAELELELLAIIKELNESVWQGRVDGQVVEQWLESFGSEGKPGQRGRLHALFLLSKFMYFGPEEIRGLLRALHRDQFRYPLVSMFRRLHADTLDEGLVEGAFKLQLKRARFLGMGSPAESGWHLLYHYRQENALPSALFIGSHEIFDLRQPVPVLALPDVARYVFIDDFCGSGQQAVDYAQHLVWRMKEAAKQAGVTIDIQYHVLVGTKTGLQHVEKNVDFDRVVSVLELDDSFKAFGANSRYFHKAPSEIDSTFAASLALLMGMALWPADPLGHDSGQLMLGFAHNTPDNTMPIFWHPGHDRRAWNPVFRRYHKHL